MYLTDDQQKVNCENTFRLASRKYKSLKNFCIHIRIYYASEYIHMYVHIIHLLTSVVSVNTLPQRSENSSNCWEDRAEGLKKKFTH